MTSAGGTAPFPCRSAQQGRFAIGLLPLGLTVFGYELLAVAAVLFIVDLVVIAR